MARTTKPAEGQGEAQPVRPELEALAGLMRAVPRLRVTLHADGACPAKAGPREVLVRLGVAPERIDVD